jgi:hypothetical protein
MSKSRNTKSFYFLTMLAFTISFAGTLLGLFQLEADVQTKGFFAVSYIFSIYATFALAKVIRDKAEDSNQ